MFHTNSKLRGFFNLLSLHVITSVTAQRPAGTSICDYYTTALLTNDSAANQYTLLTLLVNTAVIGNYTEACILNPNGMYNGTAVNLVPYFNGCDVSTNNGTVFNLVTNPPISQNFLDGGGAAPLMNNMPANDMTSNHFLLTHLYQYFGVLLGCSKYNSPGFPAYGGVGSMYRVHQYMALDPYEIGYFITQVGLSAASFGVAQSDINIVASALFSLFSYKCEPPVTVVPAQGPVLDSICVDVTCPAAPNAMCGLYDNMNGTSPSPATASSCLTGTMTSTSMSNSMSTSMATSCPTQTGKAYTKTETFTKTVTVTKKPHQTHVWCDNEWQWCNK
ncbi:hypothetical protein LTR91_004963 [Friedmanniomyces endolithicus]|uniref:Heme haloperoxidase family profile domain-containing protein n=1 Tax=Friedmanniomyces endolithicus TaxID=329885 RepID=A0AAN6KU96_9PEZI|nr:hypothetical protein LTR01_005676 [Friedmanniomyces endolithicus]KAK0323142.1 hypothetical protein LTR82_006073 [Friedmanniomyces endolithicus]KAK0922289.1 hypothetical protein LTR57_007977 [Friedmanniomyces endolithicus]KAK1002821.1 hypothetical protein LTR91_004963 [Friedmanniomyces endolithicus]KAK1039900.1 hypothetical protein LTS16_010840 [Friedmanniomyces endolithicus]